MSKNQKPAVKQQSKKETEIVTAKVTEPKQCPTAEAIFDNLKPDYDEIVAENNALKKDLITMTRNYKSLSDEMINTKANCTAELKKRDDIIRSLQENVNLYRTRGVWATIKYHWFSC